MARPRVGNKGKKLPKVTVEKSLEEIAKQQYPELPREMKMKQGEDLWGWLERITPLVVEKRLEIGFSPFVDPKVRDQSLAGFLNYTIPQKQTIDITATRKDPLVGMDEEEAKRYVMEYLGVKRIEEKKE